MQQLRWLLRQLCRVWQFITSVPRPIWHTAIMKMQWIKATIRKSNLRYSLLSRWLNIITTVLKLENLQKNRQRQKQRKQSVKCVTEMTTADICGLMQAITVLSCTRFCHRMKGRTVIPCRIRTVSWLFRRLWRQPITAADIISFILQKQMVWQLP